MKPILIREYIPPQVKDGKEPIYSRLGNLMNQMEGTGVWSENFTQEAFFDSWITEYTRNEDGIGSTRVYAMVVLPDGTVTQLDYDKIKFTDLK